LAVDGTDPVTIAVKSEAKMEVLCRDQGLQVCKVLFLGRVRMVVRKSPVNLGEEQMMLARKLSCEEFDGGAGGAVAGVPADAQVIQLFARDAGQPFHQPVDVGSEDLAALGLALAVEPVTGGGHGPQFKDIGPEERPALKYHLEAIVIGGIVAASYLNAALHVFHLGFGIIEHGRGPHADADDVDSRAG